MRASQLIRPFLFAALLSLVAVGVRADGRRPRYAWALPTSSPSVGPALLAPSRPRFRRHPFPLLPGELSPKPLGRAAGDEALRGLSLRASAGAPATRVVLVSLDGLRADAVTPEEMPVLTWLRRHGLSAPGARTLRRSLTLPSHTSMLTGVGIAQHRLGYNSFHLGRGRSAFPSVFRVAHAAGLPTGFFVAKRKLSQILQPGDVDEYEQGGILCDHVNARSLSQLARFERGLAFVHYPDPDGAGHRDGWMSPNYHRAVRRVDRCLGELLSTLAPHGFGRTLLIVTADHGGHDHTHGTAAAIDRHIPWIAFGGAVQPGVVNRSVTTWDTAPTILRALGLPIPHGVQGHAVEAAFAQRRARVPHWQPLAAGR